MLKKYGVSYTDNIELAALGTIADVVSLTGENRIIVKEGMKRFLSTPVKGLFALIQAAGLIKDTTQSITHADQISFGLAPRLNAAGRISHAKEGVELMITDRRRKHSSWLKGCAYKCHETGNRKRHLHAGGRTYKTIRH